jgi:hypothetical protein
MVRSSKKEGKRRGYYDVENCNNASPVDNPDCWSARIAIGFIIKLRTILLISARS